MRKFWTVHELGLGAAQLIDDEDSVVCFGPIEQIERIARLLNEYEHALGCYVRNYRHLEAMRNYTDQMEKIWQPED